MILPPLLPPTVVAIETSADELAPLLPEEEAALGRVVEKRRREFSVGRACAKRALSALGAPVAPLLRGPYREPVWPDGVVGSITHCVGYCAAAVAFRQHVVSLGIDAEPAAALPEDILGLVASPDERAWVEAQGGAVWDRLLFSAKESVFKAWFPLTGRWLGFEDAHLEFDLEAATFTAELLVPGPLVAGARLQAFEGRYVRNRGVIVTSVVVEVDRLNASRSPASSSSRARGR